MFKEGKIPFIAHCKNINSSDIKLHLNHNGIKVFAENFSVFFNKFNRRHQRKISLHMSANLNSERESHVLETPDRNLY